MRFMFVFAETQYRARHGPHLAFSTVGACVCKADSAGGTTSFWECGPLSKGPHSGRTYRWKEEENDDEQCAPTLPSKITCAVYRGLLLGSNQRFAGPG